MVNLLVNPHLSDSERRGAVFNGSLLLYPRSEATSALVDHARHLIAEAFGDLEPERAQFSLKVEEFVSRVGPLKTCFTNGDTTRRLVQRLLAEADCDLERTYFDLPRLRVVPHGGYLTSGVSYAYKAHRDTWYASPTCQVNWWMPVFDVSPERAMSFFPAYFDKPASNRSAEFDYDEWCRVGRKLAAEQIDEDTRNHPLPSEPIDTSSELRIAGMAGEPIVFSACQLHATAPNVSGVTRFSVDFRTVSLDDLELGLGGPNVDCAATGSTLGDFIRTADLVAHLLSPAVQEGADVT
ncbi:MAG TPA: hypothetical protein VEH29_04270 [Acidimicrobiales bacterium]|nr:hypothetical protein [Acidimicrobiales bacterium]